ncbi:MAG: radical SAM family heme chaperone HemW [Candidatus Nitrospinota bacterium M3_3B_026]
MRRKTAPNPIGVYVHFPFCRHKCFYCDFVSIAGREDLIDGLVNALELEISTRADLAKEKAVRSVFFGGGTPSMLYPEQVERIMATLRKALRFGDDVEVTMEMNPESVTPERLAGFIAAGVNRASVGVQSLDDGQLAFLERVHTADDARRAVRDVFAAGFENVSVDMMFGLPGQTMKDWMTQLREAMTWGLSHLSLYQLTPERGTPLETKVREGNVALPPPEETAELYDAAEDLLASFNFRHYEVSNWARPGRECAHNMNYWENGDYLGLGAAAHGKIDGKRWENERSVEGYIERTLKTGSAVAETEKLTPGLVRMERLMMGLRLEKGVPVEEIEITPAIGEMIAEGMLEVRFGRLAATSRGRRLLDSVLEKV